MIQINIKTYKTRHLYPKQQLIGLVSTVNMDIVWGKSFKTKRCSSVLE